MISKKRINIFVVTIVILGAVCCLTALIDSPGAKFAFTSITGEVIDVYGEGLYKNNSVSGASQAIAQDIVTLILGIPLLIISLVLFNKRSLKGLFMLTGMLGYFLYTYASYSFLLFYNYFFIIYVTIMSISFFAFIMCFNKIMKTDLCACFKNKFNNKTIGCYMLFIAIALFLMWMGRIIPPLINNSTTDGLEHYTTLIIQAMDLGFIVPVCALAGVLTIRKNIFGYILSSIITFKGVALTTALSAMIIGQIINGINVSLIEIIIFGLFNALTVYILIVILKHIKGQFEYSSCCH